MPGVIRTRVGYAGGTTTNPTYRNIGNHTEAIQIDYDPTRITYKELLDVFWKSHRPTAKPWSRQYMSIILYHNDEQKMLALETKEREESRLKSKIFTQIVPSSEFTLAEAYHQKYRLRQDSALMREFRAMYSSTKDFVASTAAARVNGFVGGYGSAETLKAEIDSYGLSEAGKKRLMKITGYSTGVQCPVKL